MTDVSIAVVDDHPLLLEGISTLLQRKGGFSLVSTGSTAEQITTITATYAPQVMIIDLGMPGDAFLAISNAAKTASTMKIIVFTASTSTDHAIQALDAGASGYVLKGSPVDDLFDAIAAAQRGEIYISPVFAAKVIGALQSRALAKRSLDSARLSVREDQIIRLLLCGKQNREIAHALSLSEKTIKGYMTNLMHKLNARNRLEVVIAAQKFAQPSGDSLRSKLK